MIWQDFAIDELKKYFSRQMALLNLEDRIKELNAQFTSLGGNSNATPVMGGHSKIEDKLLNIIVSRDELKANYDVVKRSVERVGRGLAILDEREKEVLNGFYIHRTPDYVDRLCDKLCIEKSQVYRTKDKALYKFTLAMYGIIDR